MPNLTTNYSFNKPLVNDPIDEDLWGGQLNSNWDSVDTILPAISATEFGAIVVQSTDDASFETLSGQGTSGQILTSNGADALPSFETAASPFSAGFVVQHAGSTEPSGWIFTFGQAISRTTFSDLFAVISTTYGVGDGSTTFNVPDIRGRVVAGRDDMGGVSANRLTDQSGGVDGDVLGDTGGDETHQLTETELAAHTHTTPGAQGDNSTVRFEGGGASTTFNVSTSSTGGDTAHNNVQPTIILNYIIKT